jgi:hypothetical protein
MDGIKIKEGNSMNNNDVLEAIDKLPGGEIMWYGPAPSWTATPRLTTRALKSLRQRVLDLEAENAGLIAGLKQAEGYVMETREALALRDCVECGICAFEVSPVDSSQGFCWNCQKFLTIKLAEKILNGGDDE